jgi:hypothetical protein
MSNKNLTIYARTWVLSGMIIILTTACLAVDNKSHCWEGRYEADAMPGTAGFIFGDDYDPTGAFTVGGGLLNIDSMGSDNFAWVGGGQANSHLGSPMTFATGASLEIRFRVNAVEEVAGGEMLIRFSDSAGNHIWGEISPGGGGYYNYGPGGDPLDTFAPVVGSSFHTLRLTMSGTDEVTPGTGVVTAYLDDNPLAAGSAGYTFFEAATPNARLLDDGTGADDADWDIDYVRWTDAGAFAPDNDPVCVADYDYDDNGIVNLKDFTILANWWLSLEQPPVFDISGDNTIGIAELRDFVVYWLEMGERPTAYITDLDQSLPASALSTQLEQDKWQLVPYQTALVEGTMLAAPTYVNAPDVTIPCDLLGWYAIYVGYWNFEFHFDGDSLIKLKLSEEAAFRQISEPPMPADQRRTYLREVFVDNADVTGQDFVLGKSSGLTGKKTYLAYIKLVPLSDQEVQQIQNDRDDSSTRKVIAAIDGYSYFQNSEWPAPQNMIQFL